jgi:dolichyl-phosphate-mannose-protein mannosyltransferase
LKTKRYLTCIVIALLAAWSAAASAFFFLRGYTLYYGDAESHLNIARRIFDSRTPGTDQIGSVWLPLPHLLLMPFAARDALWKSGLAGTIPSAVCFVIAGSFLFAAARRVFASDAAGAAALALFALNPNVLYLQSTPMSEPVFWAAQMAMLYFSVLFRENQAWWAAAGAGVACLAGTLSRYEGWFLVPALTLYFLIAARSRRLMAAALVGAIASLGPLAWLAHNRYWFGDALYFFRGPDSAAAIQGGRPYPGYGDWKLAAIFYQSAAVWCAGPVLRWIGAAGLLGAVARKTFWPLVFLAVPGVFYVWNMHSGASPIYTPDLWYGSYYNTRYGLAVLPLAVFAAAALVAWMPPRAQGWTALLLIAAASAPWLLHPSPERWITWKESQVNSEARRQWTRQAVALLSPRYHPKDGIFTSFSDLTGIYRTMGLPLRETLTWDNEPQWLVTTRRPDLFLWEQWAVCVAGDPVQRAIHRARRQGPYYELVYTIEVKDAPAVEIYRRSSRHENPIH